MIKSPLHVAMLAVLLASCAPPTHSVTTVDVRPRLQLSNATPSGMLYVDGVVAGRAVAYGESGAALALDHGTHKIEVREGERVIFSQSVYLGEDMLKTISLPGER